MAEQITSGVGAKATFDPYREVDPDEFAGSSTWALTLAILAGLLLIGFFAGFVTRGAATAAIPSNQSAPLQMISQPNNGFDVVTGKVQQALTLGTQTSDELLGVARGASADEFLVAIKIHSNSPDLPDELSLIRILANGEVQETFRYPGAGQATLAALPKSDGGAFLASTTEAQFSISMLSESGDTTWTKTYPILSAASYSPEVKAYGADIVALAPSNQGVGTRLISIDQTGTAQWSLDLPSIDNASLIVGDSGEIFLVSESSSESAALITAITPRGIKAWTSKIWLEDNETILGSSVSNSGGIVTVLKNGSRATLLEYDVSGVLVSTATIDLDLSAFSGSAIAPSDDGNILIYGMVYDQTSAQQFAAHKIAANGKTLAYAEMNVPTTTAINGLVPSDINNIIVAGSARLDRYSGTDIHISRLSLIETPLASPELAPSTELVLAAADSPSNVQNIVFEQERSSRTSQLNPELSLDAALGGVADETVSEETEYADFTSSSVLLTRFASPSWTDGSRGAIVSTAQCRFSCVDSSSIDTSFPIWRSIELRDGEPTSPMSELHEQSCRSAGGSPLVSEIPDCTDRF